MPQIGTIATTLHTVDRNETIYARAGNNVSHVDVVALRRSPVTSPLSPLRTNVRFERGFLVRPVGATGLEKSVTVSIAITTPPGIDAIEARAYMVEALTQAAEVAADVGITGDIHL